MYFFDQKKTDRGMFLSWTNKSVCASQLSIMGEFDRLLDEF